MKKAAIIVIAALVGIPAFLFLATIPARLFFGALSGPAEGTPVEGAKLAAAMGLTLPADARVEHARYFRGIDDAGQLVFVLPESNWHAWVARLSPADPPLFDAGSNGNLDGDMGSWQPSHAPGLKSAQVRWRGSEFINIGRSPAGGGRVRVFIFWHET